MYGYSLQNNYLIINLNHNEKNFAFPHSAITIEKNNHSPKSKAGNKAFTGVPHRNEANITVATCVVFLA